MSKPLLIVVTGCIASGKTTLAHILANKINLPLLSRDELKEGYINTPGNMHTQINKSVDLHIYDTFFAAIDLLVSKGVSIIVEAAFQNKLWKPKIADLLDTTTIKIIVCHTNIELVKTRFTKRLLQDPGREKYHGDSSLILMKEQFTSLTESYEPVNINTPTLQVDTTNNYNPAIEEIINFIQQKNTQSNAVM